jgi:FtsZ-interacting cell division protein ZipA
MSDLQIAMIVLGVVLVVAVWFYNRWLEKRHRQRAEQILPKPRADVLKARPAEKTEPGIAAPVADEAVATTVRNWQDPAELPDEPGFMDADLPLEPDTRTLGEMDEVDLPLDFDELADGQRIPVPEEWGDGRADCLLRMEFVAPVPIGVLWEEHKDWSASIDKPVQWLGLDEQARHWRSLFPQDAGKVKQVAVALQLVDRLGAVGEETLKRFVDGVTRLAQRFVGQVELPDVASVLTRARELDAFCASVDLQLSLHVLPARSPQMSGAQLKPLMDAAGLRLEGERYVAFDAADAEAYALICRSATSFPAERVDAMELIDLIFSLDVPRVATGTATFDRLIAFARESAATLGGQLADAHRKPLGDATVAVIRGRIEELQQRMTERGIPPGSVRALRLFS